MTTVQATDIATALLEEAIWDAATNTIRSPITRVHLLRTPTRTLITDTTSFATIRLAVTATTLAHNTGFTGSGGQFWFSFCLSGEFVSFGEEKEKRLRAEWMFSRHTIPSSRPNQLNKSLSSNQQWCSNHWAQWLSNPTMAMLLSNQEVMHHHNQATVSNPAWSQPPWTLPTAHHQALHQLANHMVVLHQQVRMGLLKGTTKDMANRLWTSEQISKLIKFRKRFI